MSAPPRSLSSHLRGSSISGGGSGPSPALVARIEEKKAELENLRQLRDLSAAVAGQMEALEQKLSTLSDGTEGLGPFDLAGNRGLLTVNSYCDCHGQLA